MEIARLGALHLALIAIALCLVNGVSELQADLPAATDDVDLTVPVEGDEAPDLEEEFETPFHRIRHLAVTFQSQEHKAESRLDCEDVCSQNGKCKSFSFRARDNKCLTSPYSLDYDAGWTLNLKDTAPNHIGMMTPTGEWTPFTNVKFVDPKMNSGAPSSSDEETCKQQCEANDECGAYSYSSKAQLCYLGNDGIMFNAEFSYYERNAPKQDMPVKENKLAQEGVALPENKEEEGKLEEEKAKPRLMLPDEAAHDAKLAEYAARIKAINADLDSPSESVDVDPKKEHARKQRIRNRELESQVAASKNRKVEDKTFQLLSQVHVIEAQTQKTVTSGQRKLKDIAHQAFDQGYRMAAQKGRTMQAYKVEKLREKFAREAANDERLSDNPLTKAAEKRKKKEALAAYNARVRMKEAKTKKQKHKASVLLGQKVASLIHKEGKTKAQKHLSVELAVKQKHNDQVQQMATSSAERSDKQLIIMKAKGQQGDDVEQFEMEQALSKQKQAEAEIALEKRQKKYEAEEKRRTEEKQQKIEETSGVRERGSKDEKEAAMKETKVKQLEMKAAQEKMSKLQVPKDSKPSAPTSA
jgi:hypothetical protein